MNRKGQFMIAIATAVLVLGGAAMAAQDKYSLISPRGHGLLILG